MFDTFKKAWRIPEIRKKILYTLLLVLIFRLGAFIPIPGVNPAYIQQQVESYDILGFLNLMTGGSFGNFTVLALGITPYINASIIMQLLTIAIPALERMAKEGEIGRKKIERITRFLGVFFSLAMGIGTVLSMGQGAVTPSNIIPPVISYLTIGLVLAAGTAFLMWLGELITEVGIGNGTSFIIFTGIVARLPSGAWSLIEGVRGGQYTFWILPIILVGAILVVAGVTFVDLGERRVPVQYAKRVVGRKMYGGQSTNIPIRVNSNGVLPLIFAMTITQFPAMIAQFWPQSAFALWYAKWMGTGSVLYFVVYVVLIIAFSFFYTMVTFNPIEMSKNMQANGGFIPGIRPGKPTSDFLQRISFRLTFFSAIFLALIAALPTLLAGVLNMSSAAAFGATSLLIMVSVALETNKQLEAQITMRYYKGFLK